MNCGIARVLNEARSPSSCIWIPDCGARRPSAILPGVHRDRRATPIRSEFLFLSAEDCRPSDAVEGSRRSSPYNRPKLRSDSEAPEHLLDERNCEWSTGGKRKASFVVPLKMF